MHFLALCALAFAVQTVSSQSISIQPTYTSPENKLVLYTLRKPLVVSCNVSIEGIVPASVNVEWKKDDVLVSEVESLKGRFSMSTSKNGYTFTLTVSESKNEDTGNWTCSALIDGELKDSASIHVTSYIAVKIKSENINVVEEEKLRVECSVLGSPFPSLSWRIYSTNYNGSEFDDRVEIQNYTDDKGHLIEDGVLIIRKVNKSDRGLYFCKGTHKFFKKDTQEAQSMIRVKDKYAALWPFLGICTEVIVLCAIIIIYEKKRNKTELEESDTDQSPDQKNTPDHGKDANLRHRQ